MDNPQGKVESVHSDTHGTRAVVGVDVASACQRCAAGKGCGAGIFTASGKERHVEAAVRPGLQIVEGDFVEMTLAPDNLLRAALIVYGLPMAGAILGAIVAYALSLGDVGAAIAALVGLLGGLTLGRRRLRRQECLSRFVPTIDRRVGQARDALN